MKVVNPDAMKSQTKKVVRRVEVETRPVGFRKINIVNYGF